MPGQVIAARSRRPNAPLETCSSYTLPPGSLTPALAGNNVANRQAVQEGIASAMGEVADRSRDIIAVIPDAAVRVVLLDFDSLPEKKSDADAMVRFRLKKSLPFDVEQSTVSYDFSRRDGVVKVVAVVALRSVLDEYESIFRAAGYIPGVVLPSTFAALGTVQADEPTMVLKVDSMTSTLAIVQADQLLLFRTLENPSSGQESGEQLTEDIYPSLVFFEDNYSLRVSRILVAGRVSAAQVGPALEAGSGAQVADLISDAAVSSTRVSAAQVAGVMGALH